MVRGDEIHYQPVSLVRHLEHMAIRDPAFDCVAVEQRWPCRTANHKGHLPRNISSVRDRRIKPLTAERARQMTGVAQQKSPSIAEPLGGSLVHPKIGNPLQIVQANVGVDALIQQCPNSSSVGNSVRVSVSLRLTNISQRSSGSGENNTNPLGPTTMRPHSKGNERRIFASATMYRPS